MAVLRERAVMGQCTDHNDHANMQSQLADYYRWVEPDRGIRIYINFETANRLQVKVLRGLDAGGGLEVGGILLGRTALDGGRITAIIDDFAAVPCTYSKGPLYSVTGADADNFEAVLARLKADTGSGLSIVGYYRSHNRNNLYLSAEDLTLIRSAFPGIDNVFLLVKPLPMRACTAGFFFWERGKIQSEFTLEVPFAPIMPPSSASSQADAIDDFLLPARLGLSAASTTIPPGQAGKPAIPIRERLHGRTRDAAALALGLVISLGIIGYWQLRRSNGASLSAVAQNLTGSIPSSHIPGLKPSREREKAPVANRSQQPVLPSQARILEERARQQDVSLPPVSGIDGNSEPAGATIPTGADGKLEQPPFLPSETNLNELAFSPTAITLPPAVPDAPPLEVMPQRTEPVSAVQQKAAGSRAEPNAPLPRASRANYVGPEIIHRANPTIQPNLRSLIASGTEIDVTVNINPDGKVTDAKVTSSRGVAAKLVAMELIKASWSFRFQPARENDRAVRSKMVLTFLFK